MKNSLGTKTIVPTTLVWVVGIYDQEEFMEQKTQLPTMCEGKKHHIHIGRYSQIVNITPQNTFRK